MNDAKAENEILTLSADEVQRRYWSRVRVNGDTGCWEWAGHLATTGYGRLTVHYRGMLTHRAAYVLAHGPIPNDLWVLHHCDNPACVNPDHLFLGTNQDNVDDRQRKGRGHTGYVSPDRRARGERHWSRTHPELIRKGGAVHNARLTEQNVQDIRKRHATGDVALSELARQYGVTKQAIWNVVKRRNWKHAP